VGTNNNNIIYLLQSPAGVASNTGLTIGILNHGINTTFNNTGQWNQRMNVFCRDANGNNN
jgi:hypothetical protein